MILQFGNGVIEGSDCALPRVDPYPPLSKSMSY